MYYTENRLEFISIFRHIISMVKIKVINIIFLKKSVNKSVFLLQQRRINKRDFLEIYSLGSKISPQINLQPGNQMKCLKK